jgi:hypothetical protein
METPKMNLIAWIKDAKSFHFIKQVVEYTSAPLEEISPKPIDSLVVNTFSYITNRQILSLVIEKVFLWDALTSLNNVRPKEKGDKNCTAVLHIIILFIIYYNTF